MFRVAILTSKAYAAAIEASGEDSLLRGHHAMKKIHAAVAAGVALSTILVAAPAFAQFGGMLGALAASRANTANANAATSAMANAQAQAQATAQAQAAAFSPVGLPPAAALVAPTPIAGNTGKYMSPFTAAGEPAAWVAKAQGSAAGAVGAMAGNYVGDKVAEQATAKVASMVPVPGLGMLAGRMARSASAAAAKNVTQTAVGGGEAFIKSSSDQSFNTVQDLAIYLYVNHSARADYAAALQATTAVYPEFQASYLPAVQSASLK